MTERPSPQRRPARRRRLALLLAATLPLAPMAQAAPRCAAEPDQAVFEIEALKTELVVIAISCKEEEKYNAFVRRYQSHLAENGRAFGQYFTRTRGRTGQRANDQYITNLANVRGNEAQVLGTDFCPRNTQLFEEVMALPSGAELASYATGKNLFTGTLTPCDGQSAAAAAPARRATPARASARTPAQAPAR